MPSKKLILGPTKNKVYIKAWEKVPGKPDKEVQLVFSEEKFREVFLKTAQAQHDTFVKNIKDMPPNWEQALMKTMGVSKKSLLKQAEQFNHANHGKKGK